MKLPEHLQTYWKPIDCGPEREAELIYKDKASPFNTMLTPVHILTPDELIALLRETAEKAWATAKLNRIYRQINQYGDRVGLTEEGVTKISERRELFTDYWDKEE